jgi:putative Mg2+ transporter-C (MgtC) family protein
VLSCLMVLISLWILNKIELNYFGGKKIHTLNIHAIDQPGSLGLISSLLGSKKIDIRKISMQEVVGDDVKTIQMIFMITMPKVSIIPSVLEDISKLPGIIGVTVE